MVLEVALYGRRPYAFPPSETTAVDAVQVEFIDLLLEAFTGALEWQNARQRLSERAAAVQTSALANLQREHTPPRSPVVVADHSPAPSLIAQARSPTVWA